MDPIRRFKGMTTQADGSTIPVVAEIFPPEPNEGHPDWSCRIHCPFLFDTDKRIIGVDGAQAIELSEMFVKDLLDHRGVVVTAEEQL